MIRIILIFNLLIALSVAPPPLPEDLGDFSQCKADCDSHIYCQGKLLKTFMLAKIHDHPKDFVDQKLLADEELILRKFDELEEEKKKEDKPLDKDTLKAFEKEYFAKDLPTKCKLRDLDLKPKKLLDNISDPAYQKFVEDIQEIWQDLAGEVDKDAETNPGRHSMIYLPKCYIKRSQPPFLPAMVKHYLDAKPDDELPFLNEHLLTIETEFLWWMNNREIKFKKNNKEYIMYQYRQESCYPRPEGYVKDYEKGLTFETDKQRNFFYTQTHSVAESGLDFSTRQRRPNFYEEGYGTRKNLDITRLVPVELNSLLAMNAGLLSEWFAKIGEHGKSEKYRKISETLIQYIDEVFRVEELKAWFDWDIKDGVHRTNFYPTNLSPLYAMAYDKKKADHFGKTAVEYLKESLILHPDGPLEGKPKFVGVPTSMILSPEQWDYRNSWAPLQSFVIEGLLKTENDQAVQVAQELAKIWVKSNYVGLYQNKHMFEKYDALIIGEIGGGGTYTAQTGFGWSNGLVLTLLDLFGKILKHTDYDDFKPDKTGVIEDANVGQ